MSTAAHPPRTGPLAGVRVLDFTAAMAGPACCMMLADFGADVIKIEPPAGEGGRVWGTGRFGPDGDLSGLFVAFNRNKRGVALDLKSAAGRAAVDRLIESADVIVENFKPGVADRLGIGYERARELRPDIVHCSISGFGQNGPLRERPGLDNLLQAYAGHLSVTGEPGRPSARIGPSAIDLLTGSNAAFGIMVALWERRVSGQGQSIDTSLYDTSLHLMSHFIAEYTGTGRLPEKSGPYFAFLSPYGIYRASDREFFFGCNGRRNYEDFCRRIGREDLITDPRFGDNGSRIAHRDELNEILVPVFAAEPAEHWIDLCVRLSIPTSLVHDLSEVLEQEQLAAREMAVDAGHGLRTAGLPVKLGRTPARVLRGAPHLAEHQAEVLGEAGAVTP
ncbi:CaiB/BaiF CoA transferase family protein [Streptomyces specialis]|uniref:CaiB/BaiF CoA transferase family protein n=1 Tax=Streptomyces specialis TaxID=498367 RepID=UPI00099EC49F|nr:CoA transferase [Streptomyces specialis]